MKIDVQSLVMQLGESVRFDFKEDNTPLFIPNDNSDLFVSPPIKIRSNNFEKSVPIIILSAPGAVGKTMLANYIAYKTNSCLWDLSKIRIGDHTFVGAVADSFHDDHYSEVVSSVAKGSMNFVFDAFDEAEIRSGISEVKGFVYDIYKRVKDTDKPCVVFLARTETAKKIVKWLDQYSGGNNSAYWLFEIDYFDSNSGFDLAKKYMDYLLLEDKSRKDKKYPLSYEKFTQHIMVAEEIFNDLINGIAKSIQSTQNEQLENSKFIGYAPVIQAIGISIISASDNLKDAKKILNPTSTDNGEIITELMSSLLKREQEKMTNALKLKAQSITNSSVDWSNIYTPSEQLIRLGLYIYGDNSCFKHEHSETDLPGQIVDVYEDVLGMFLPQHPFLSGKDFAGPAFRDYLYANLLDHDLMSMFIEDKLMNKERGLTPLFHVFCFKKSCIIKGIHVGYLYESITAQEGLEDSFEMIISKDMDRDIHVWDISLDDDVSVKSVDVIIDDDCPLVFNQKLSRARMQLDGRLELRGENFEIGDVEVICKSLYIDSKKLYLQLSEANELNITSDYCTHNSDLRIYPVNEGEASFNWDGSEKHPWSYHHNGSLNNEKDQITYKDAFLALRGVLKWFRRDRREEYAKHHEQINNVAVGKNRTRKVMLDFLIESGVIKQVGVLYVYNNENKIASSLNWGSIRQGEMIDTISPFLNKFISYYNERVNSAQL